MWRCTVFFRPHPPNPVPSHRIGMEEGESCTEYSAEFVHFCNELTGSHSVSWYPIAASLLHEFFFFFRNGPVHSIVHRQ